MAGTVNDFNARCWATPHGSPSPSIPKSELESNHAELFENVPLSEEAT